MDELDLDALEQAAREAGGGCWFSTGWTVGSRGFEVGDLKSRNRICSDATERCAEFIASANPAAVIELLDRLEAAESEAIEQARLNGMGSEREAALMAKLEAAEKERDALRTKVAEMKKQEPVRHEFQGRDGAWYPFIDQRHYENTVADGTWPIRALYALPGALSAQCTPDGWLRAIDEALVVAHIGVANTHDTYEQAKVKLDNLISFNVEVATDPAVNGGYKLVPIDPTLDMLASAILAGYAISASRAEHSYRAMLAAAPEVKS